ncbi:MAG: type I-C CRISPR-associated protein Cas5c [Aquidulcibacter sp.]|uniref:type I-C CRISPR-associated protein Cas5c n=1 Tax=Aquidulcibacter sp. TaxID=2052990 RepID=UPI0022C93068|nr:type I-C CRISPR-associated protein Cas5c [Aquidulcibacter sp.]MCE2891762.1 type I-C CRISPR-associated protein Cas5c [Hyphomonadaceae bacterium]MCZ8208702.1 type I-C CRISPR-associated protein Cas5c [Aquidulcibacter sp.]
MTYGIKLRVTGPYACFTRPEMKVERVSYEVMTPSAARGILEAIHWKPAIRWVIDAIHVCKPIKFQSIRRNEVGSKAPAGSIKSAMKRGDTHGLGIVVDEDRQQRAATVLIDVEYVIEAHFEPTSKWGPDDNEAKHLDTFVRRTRRGQCFHQPSLGLREFVCAFSLVEDQAHAVPFEATAQLGFGTARDLGFMLWDIEHQTPGKPSVFFRATLQDGVMRVPQPGARELMR